MPIQWIKKESSQYQYGARKERAVARYLRDHGWDVSLSKGSRGAYDLAARKDSRFWLIQVKATRKQGFHLSMISPQELTRLKKSATSTKGNPIPVVCLVSRNEAVFLSARSGRELDPR